MNISLSADCKNFQQTAIIDDRLQMDMNVLTAIFSSGLNFAPN
jgi:hypothetical protein